MLAFLKKHWPIVTISVILAIILGLNFHPGKLVLGNDNFSPELDPKLTVIRSFLNPAWRDNRVLGIPSDSEQADVWRTLIFWLGSQFLPTWIISQGYLFLTLIIGVISMGKAVRLLTNSSHLSEFFGSLLYLFSPITIWIYFYPVHLFVAAYAFTPLVLWMSLRTIKSPSRTNKLLLLLSSLLMGTTALTATMFITASATMLALTFIYSIVNRQIKAWFITLLIYLLPHLFWILPFATYVKSNSAALQNSAINREITAATIASEQSNNTWSNTLRFSTAWIDSKEDDQNYTYLARNWFRENPTGINLGYTLAILATLGLLASLLKVKTHLSPILTSLLSLIGFIFLNGYNPPFNFIYSLFDQYVPLFHQVFRWISSKFWPLLLYPLIILASLALSKIITFAKFRLLQTTLTLSFVALIIYSAHPIISYRLIREEVFVSVPDNYSNLKDNLVDKVGTIDTTPHTNTRYFRKYDWGFWGSVFLNYFLPNPTTEKALVIGSDENQIAYDTLDQAYNSQAPDIYSTALARYSITQVLSDRSATNKGLGLSYAYPFDWNTHDKVVINNQNLTLLWQQDFLKLYQTNTTTNNHSNPLSPLHNSQILNKSLAMLKNSDPYHYESQGTIYPLYLESSQIKQGNDALSLTTIIKDQADYQLTIPSSTIKELPLLAYITNSTLTLTPYFPQITHNSEPLYSLPTSSISLDNNPITINSQLITSLPTLLEPNKSLEIKTWTQFHTLDLKTPVTTICNHDRDNPTNQNCYRSEFNTTNSSIVAVTTTLSAPHPVLVDLCLHSQLHNSCLNSPRTYLVNSQPQTLTLSSNIVVNPKDNIVVFYVAKTVDGIQPNLKISQLSVTVHTNSQTLKLPQLTYTDVQAKIQLNPGNTLTTQLPITNVIPPFQLFRSFCSGRGNNNDVVQNDYSTTLTTANCFDGLFSSFSLPPYLNTSSLLTYIKADNNQGISLEFNIKQDKVARKLTTDLLSTNDSDFLNFTILPKDNQNLTIELVNKGIGTVPTTNTLHNFASIPIPQSWLSLALTSTTRSPKTIIKLQPFSDKYSTGTYVTNITDVSALYTLPPATSPYWRAVILSSQPRNLLDLYFQSLTHNKLTDKTLVNGYLDTWNVQNQDQGRYLAVIFIPNVLAYLGLTLGLGLAFVLIAAKPTTKTASTHTV